MPILSGKNILGIDTDVHYESISGSVANRIEEANGQLLPVDASAFQCETILKDVPFPRSEFSWFQFDTGYAFSNPREFYKHLGIKIQKPQGDMPGWYQCQLPNGWHTERVAVTFSRDESTHFCDKTGKTRFTIISRKDEMSQCSEFITRARARLV